MIKHILQGIIAFVIFVYFPGLVGFVLTIMLVSMIWKMIEKLRVNRKVKRIEGK